MSLTKVLHAKISFWGMCTLQKISGWHFSILIRDIFLHFWSWVWFWFRQLCLQKKLSVSFNIENLTLVNPSRTKQLLPIKLLTNKVWWIKIPECSDKIILTLALKTEKRWEKAADEKRCIIWLNLAKVGKMSFFFMQNLI